MKKINIFLALAVLLISLNGFSQTVKDIDNVRLEINMALIDNDADLIIIGDMDPDFKDVGYYQIGSKIVRINCNVLTVLISKGTSDERIFTSDLNFYYQNDELIFIEMREKLNKTDKSSTNSTTTHLYFDNGELLAGKKEVAMFEYETIDDPGKLEQKYRFVARAEYLLEKVKNYK